MDEISAGYISSIFIGEEEKYPITVSGNLRLDKSKELGIPYYQFLDNSNYEEYYHNKNYILRELANDSHFFTQTLVINKKVLDDDEYMDAIRQKANRMRRPLSIRIADEGYTLTKEDYDKLSFAKYIAVDHVSTELTDKNNIIQQEGTFKFDFQSFQPVLERRNKFSQLVSRISLHINHQLTDKEFEQLATTINNYPESSIELDYYNQSYYEKFLKGLQKHNVRPNINIRLIGYLLDDNTEIYEKLEQYPYEIDVTYSTCHDMINKYVKEPYTENRLYYSQVEGGGITSLGNYLNILEELINFETLAKTGNLSPLEIAILAKIKIDSEFIYDPDYKDRNNDYWDNTNLSQLIHHQKNGQRRAICVGFATLFSAYCRRCGLPMFRYSTNAHMRSIGRIKDDKYEVDTVSISDITWDLPFGPNKDIKSYKNFMIPPRYTTKYTDKDGIHEFLTIASVFALPIFDFFEESQKSIDSIEKFYSPFFYDPLDYAIRMIELMGLASEKEEWDLYDTIYKLCEEKKLEGIPEETLYKAIENVLHFLSWDEDKIRSYLKDVKESIEIRPSCFNEASAVSTNTSATKINDFIDVLTPETVQAHRNILDTIPADTRIIINKSQNNIGNNDIIEQVNEENNLSEPIAESSSPQEAISMESNDNNSSDYIYKLINYCQDNNISIYHYYRNVGALYHHDNYEKIPEFETENPFITEEDKEQIGLSKELLITHYFADIMMKTIGINLPPEKRKQYDVLFSKSEDMYLQALKQEISVNAEEKKKHPNQVLVQPVAKTVSNLSTPIKISSYDWIPLSDEEINAYQEDLKLHPIKNSLSDEEVDIDFESPVTSSSTIKSKEIFALPPATTNEKTESNSDFDYSEILLGNIGECSSLEDFKAARMRIEELKRRQKETATAKTKAEKEAADATARVEESKRLASEKKAVLNERMAKLLDYEGVLKEDCEFNERRTAAAYEATEASMRIIEEQEAEVRGADDLIAEIDSVIAPEATNVVSKNK